MQPTRRTAALPRQPPNQARPKPPPPKRPSASVPIWALLVMVGMWFVVCIGVWGYVSFTRPTIGNQPTSEAEFVVITSNAGGGAAATTAEPTLFLLGTATPVLTATIPAGPGAGQIQIGALVQVSGTGTDGLRMRQTPGLSGNVNYLAIEFEVFQVQDGPSTANDFTWWFLVALDDQTRSGWAVENFLQVIQNP